MVVRRRNASITASGPSTAAILVFSSSGSSSMARTTPLSDICSWASGQEITVPLAPAMVVFSARSARSMRICFSCGSLRKALKPVTVRSSLRPTPRKNSLRLPVLGSITDRSSLTILSKSPSSAAMSALTAPMRPLTKSEANLKRAASSSRILRRGPSPGPLLGQDLPLARSISAFWVETVVSWSSVDCSCSSRVEAANSAPCTWVIALSAEREASPRLSSTFQ